MSGSTMTHRERLEAAFALQPVDRPPALGGWIADAAKILALTGVSEDEYWANPVPISIEAYRRLGVDGLLDVNVPSERGGYTLVTEAHMAERARYEGPEDIVAEIERLPSPEEIVAQFDEEAEFVKGLAEMRRMQELCGAELYWCPARWEVIPNFEWYRVYGYENYLLAIALHEKHVLRLYRHSAVLAGCRARVVARMVREGLHPRAMLCGQDICSNQGPMVSPAFLREHYFPLVQEAIRPLREVGAKIVWHCDGDVRPILDDILALGVGGLQGFQQECGVRLEDIVERRTLDGEKLLIFGPISVVRTLLEETPNGVKQAVRDAVRTCNGKASLVLFTSNEILPDVPLQNMCALYEALREL
jgi:hypothetical protein